jgi:predicted RecA/RadA family phage recombinase
MKNQVGPGHAINVVAPGGGFVSGLLYKVGQMFGVAAATVPVGLVGVLWTYGEFSLLKVSAQLWATVGLPIYWDGTSLLTIASSAGNLVGVNTSTAANPSAVGIIRLNGAFVGTATL